MIPLNLLEIHGVIKTCVVAFPRHCPRNGTTRIRLSPPALHDRGTSGERTMTIVPAVLARALSLSRFGMAHARTAGTIVLIFSRAQFLVGKSHNGSPGPPL